jgi:hypothetical protein
VIKDKSVQAHVMSTELNDIEGKMVGGFCDCDCCLTPSQQFFLLMIDLDLMLIHHLCLSKFCVPPLALTDTQTCIIDVSSNKKPQELKKP